MLLRNFSPDCWHASGLWRNNTTDIFIHFHLRSLTDFFVFLYKLTSSSAGVVLTRHVFSKGLYKTVMDFLYSSSFLLPGCMDHSLARCPTVRTSDKVPPLQANVFTHIDLHLLHILLIITWQPVGECREQSGTPRTSFQAQPPRASWEKRLPWPGFPGGWVFQCGGHQLPEWAPVHTEDAVRLPCSTREHQGGGSHLLFQDARVDQGGPHHHAQVPPSQVFSVQQGDPSHQLQRGGHLHQRSLPEGSGESHL